LRNPLVLLVQMPDSMFELAILALRKQTDYHVSTSRTLLAALCGPKVYPFSDAEFARKHRLSKTWDTRRISMAVRVHGKAGKSRELFASSLI
jgi:hypothetical protein